MPLTIDTRLQIKEMELKTLLETMRAINANHSADNLYKIYRFILSSNQYLKKLALYVYDGEWSCKAHFGTAQDYSQVPLKEAALEKEMRGWAGEAPFEEFDRMIPISHKDTRLAYVFLGKSDKVDDDEKLDADFIEALTNIIVVAIENKKLARKQQRQQEYNRQLEIARNVQSLLFPKQKPEQTRFTVEASYLPHHTVGGDYYDWIQVDKDRFLICIADVSGKGMPAAILMSNFQAALRILCRHTDDLTTIVTELNHLIMQNSRGENFITAFFMTYNFLDKRLRYVNAGHNPPFLFSDDRHNRLETGTTILGAFDRLPFLNVGQIEDIDSFLAFLFTDGFTETYNEQGEEFGEEYLLKFLNENLDMEQVRLHQELIALLNTFKGNNAYADDITLLSCRLKAS